MTDELRPHEIHRTALEDALILEPAPAKPLRKRYRRRSTSSRPR